MLERERRHLPAPRTVVARPAVNEHERLAGPAPADVQCSGMPSTDAARARRRRGRAGENHEHEQAPREAKMNGHGGDPTRTRIERSWLNRHRSLLAGRGCARHGRLERYRPRDCAGGGARAGADVARDLPLEPRRR